MTKIEILQKYDEAISSFAAGLAAGLLDPDQEKSFKEQYELFKAGRDALRRTAEDDKAREEGRLVELPCKVGDTVYWMWTDGAGNCEAPICEDQIYEICITENGVELSRGPHDGGLGMIGIHPPRAVFLSQKAAEAALGGGDSNV